MTLPASVETPGPQTARTAAHQIAPVGGIMLGIVLVAYALALLSVFAPGMAEPDDNGYFAQGSLIARTGHTWFVPESDAQFVGIHWLLTPSGKYISRYPPGLAVIVAVVYKVLGWRAAALVNPALAVAGLWGLYFLLREFFRREGPPGQGDAGSLPAAGLWAVAGVVMMAFNPEYFHHALAGDAHVAVACFLLWGLYALLAWGRTQKLWLAFVAGLILGCIPTIRYPDGIMLVGAGLLMLWPWRRLRRPWAHYGVALAGVLVPLLPLLVRNQLLLGAFWRTGYSLSGEQTGFGWDYFVQNVLPYVHGMNGEGVGLMFALGLAGMLVMAWRQQWRGMGLALLLMTLPLLLVYMAYYMTPPAGVGSPGMRFLVPTFGLYVLAGLWLVREGTRAVAWPGKATVAGVLVVMQVAWGWMGVRMNADRMGYTKETLARLTKAVERQARPGDVIVTSPMIAQQLDFVRQWKVVDRNVYQPGGPGPDQGAVDEQGANERPGAQQIAKARQRAQHYSGDLALREQRFMADVARWADGHKVWLVVPERMVELYTSRQPGLLPQVQIAETVLLPEPPPGMPGPGGRGGAMGPGNGGSKGPAPQMGGAGGPGQPGGMGEPGMGNPGMGGPGRGPGMGGPGMGGSGGMGPGMNGGPGIGEPGMGGPGGGVPGMNGAPGIGPRINGGPGMGGPGNAGGPGMGGGAGFVGPGGGRGGNGGMGGQMAPGGGGRGGGGPGPGGQGGGGGKGQPGPMGGPGGGPGAGPGRGPLGELQGESAVVVAQWLLPGD
jgi:4-amino-4-deoxy-L-arabinose transferase-like glycosyltransferase